MIAPFSELLTELDVRGDAQTEWGSQNRDHRELIRQSISQNLTDLKNADQKALADLGTPPRPHNWCVSISHALNCGGWMAVRRPSQIGWDVELKSRLRPELIERVCEPDELEAAPRVGLLWSAKESYFKALEDEQPPTISALTILDWEELRPGFWKWTGLGPRNGNGLILDAEYWYMAGCRVP